MKYLYTLVLLLIISAPPLLLTGCDSPEDKFTNYIERGNSYFDEDNFVKARLEYKNALKLKPTSAEARYHLGMVDEAEGDVYNAFANFIHAEQQDKTYDPALLKLAQYFMASDQLDESINRLDTIFTTQPNNDDAIAILAAVKLRQGDMNGAEKEALRALSLNKSNTTATSVLTGLYQKQNKPEKAGAVLAEGIKNNPTDVSLLLLKASLYKKEGTFLKIREAYKALFKLKPKDIAFRQAFTTELLQEKLIDEAETSLKKIISDFPKNLNAKHNFVKFLNNHRGREQAEAQINIYIKSDPNEDQYLFWLAALYIAHHDTNKAAALLEDIVENRDIPQASSLNARTSLARINIIKGNRALAERLIDSVLSKEPNHQDALYIRANLAAQDGAYQKAITDLRTIIRDNPKAEYAYQLLAEALLSQGRIDLSIDTLGQLIERVPLAGMAVRVRLAQLFEANNNPEQGLALLQSVTKAQPNYPFGWESTARLALSAGKLKLADVAIKKVASIEGYKTTASYLSSELLVKKGNKADAALNLKPLIKETLDQPLSEHAITLLSQISKPESFTTFLESLEPKSAYIYDQLGNSYLRQQQLDKATHAYKQAIAQGTTVAAPYISLAKLYIHSKKLDGAFDLLKKASTLNPSNYLAPIIAADILTKKKNYKGAIELYENVLARNPDVDAAANNMADLIANKYAHNSAMLEKARLVAERFISSSNPLLLDTLAWVYFKEGKTQQALTIIQRAIAIDERLPGSIYYHYGRILFDTNNRDMAKIYLKKALESKDPFFGKEDVTKLLKLIK